MDDEIPQWALDLARGPAGEALALLLADGMPEAKAGPLILAAVQTEPDVVAFARHVLKLRKAARNA